MLEMTIDWKKTEAVFRLLAAVHAALGEDAVSLSISMSNRIHSGHWIPCQSRKSEREYDLKLVESQDADSQET